MDYVLKIEQWYSTVGSQPPFLNILNYRETCIRFIFINEMRNSFRLITIASCLFSQNSC